MHLRYRFRLYPTRPQRGALARVFGSCRVVFNDAVAARKLAHSEGLPYPTKALLSRALITEAKRSPKRAWLAEVSAVPLQQALADADRAHRNFFDSLAGKRAGGRVGPPRFKRRSNTQTARFTRNARFALLPCGRLRLPKIGDLKVAWSRELPAEPSSVTIIKTTTGKYYASFVVAVEDDSDMMEPLADSDTETGIDLGLADFAVLRGGKVIQNPRFFKRLERRLKKAQRALSRRVMGSANRAKSRIKVALVYEKIKNSRSDWINKQVATIVAENQGIYVEDLHVKALIRGHAAKSWHDAAAGMFLTRLESKAARAGRTFARVDRFFPSTRLCSACGDLTGPKGVAELGVRKWTCGCGAVHDRDQNAEINIRREGKRLVAAGQADT
ncbi:RNA-guided endonuclease InsQ/TnpB family protein [Glycomyces algeriensis]|uniref:RNA-guided endonuclease InsQ/TnpB family protein n=1 Tax=Glycomyces algeriensis TaxID=256037 RepID=UPI0022D3B6CA|nr:transposase [Glycomyces algeriensis]MDA1364197.1 transposase [Glycomyces algeriensis]MDR7350222.1 putative transposase [Glycomyces algeriensis]